MCRESMCSRFPLKAVPRPEGEGGEPVVMSTKMRVHAGAAVGVATEGGGGNPETGAGGGRDEGPESSPVHFTAGKVC